LALAENCPGSTNQGQPYDSDEEFEEEWYGGVFSEKLPRFSHFD